MVVRLYLIIVFLVLIMSCGHVFQVDEAFIPYVRKFEEYGKLKVNNIIIKFGYLEADTAGLCDYYKTTNQITIDQEYWRHGSDKENEMLLFHELGHCVLNRDHNTKLINRRPQSIMYPSLVDIEYYLKYYDEYINELFTGR